MLLLTEQFQNKYININIYTEYCLYILHSSHAPSLYRLRLINGKQQLFPPQHKKGERNRGVKEPRVNSAHTLQGRAMRVQSCD